MGKNIKEDKNKKRIVKTYKIYPFHYILFYSCLSICQRDKLTDFLIQTYLKKDTSQLPTYSKAELYENMIMQIENLPICELNKYQQNKRIEKLQLIFNSQVKQLEQQKGVRGFFQTYADSKIQDIVNHKSQETGTIGELIELAIEYYVVHVNEFHYDLIKLVFKKNFQDFYNSISFMTKVGS